MVTVLMPRPDLPPYVRLVAQIDRLSDRDDPILVWGVFSEATWASARPMASRFPHTNFVTGVDQGRPTQGALEDLCQDIEARPPTLIIDTSPANVRDSGKAPMVDVPGHGERADELPAAGHARRHRDLQAGAAVGLVRFGQPGRGARRGLIVYLRRMLDRDPLAPTLANRVRSDLYHRVLGGRPVELDEDPLARAPSAPAPGWPAASARSGRAASSASRWTASSTSRPSTSGRRR